MEPKVPGSLQNTAGYLGRTLDPINPRLPKIGLATLLAILSPRINLLFKAVTLILLICQQQKILV